MTIGIIVATKAELEPFFDVFGEPVFRFPNYSGFEVMRWDYGSEKPIYLILGGVGELASAASAQYLIDHFGVDGIINYGVAGGLSTSHSAGLVGIVERVVHTDFDISLSGKHVVGEYLNSATGPYIYPAINFVPDELTEEYAKLTCASADKFIGAGEPKERLRREFNADICEMEAAGIIITCNRNNVPVTFVKAVSDGVDEDSEAFENNVYKASKSCVYLIASFVQHL